MLDWEFTSCGYVEMGSPYLGSTGVGLDEAVTTWFKIGYYLPVSGYDLGLRGKISTC